MTVMDAVHQLANLEALAPTLTEQPPVSDFDRGFAELARVYLTATPPDRAQIRDAAAAHAALLWTCSIRCCEAALSTKQPDWIIWALLAHSIEDFRADPRENQIRLAAAWYTAKQLKLRPEEMFAQAQRCSSERGVTQLSEFAARPEPLKSLRVMGSEVVREGTRFIFRQIPPPWKRRPPGRR